LKRPDHAGLAFGCIEEIAAFNGEFGGTTSIWSFLNVWGERFHTLAALFASAVRP
jgi:hypothetical protein